jgi:hypothetical protein
MKRFLGMSQEEITENELMWREEAGEQLAPVADAAGEMRTAGITPGGMSAEQAGQDEMAPEDMAAQVEAGADGDATAEPTQ